MYVTTTFTAAAKKYKLDRNKVHQLVHQIGNMNCGFQSNEDIRTRTDRLIRNIDMTHAVETRPTGQTDTSGNATYELRVKVEELRKEVA